MKKRMVGYLFLLAFSKTLSAQHPQKFDSLYKTIFAKDFCKLVQNNPGIILLDVRSPGEFSDTSRFNSLNMGRLKGAINMEIDTMKKNIGVMNRYRDKTVIIYCSHSQRSRRVSKLLAENGFTNFYNLNGGMSRLNQLAGDEFPCKNEWIVSGLGYTNISNTDALKLINTRHDLVILDARPATQFNSNDSLDENNIGRIRGAINIPFAEIKQRKAELDRYKNAPILVYAASNDGDGARAAGELVATGFTKVYHLLAGLNDLVATQVDPGFLEPATRFRLLDARRALELLKTEPGLAIYDTRPKTEFGNSDTVTWKNMGNIRGAVNLPENDFETAPFPGDKNAPVLVYGHGESYRLARMLTGKGYKRVYLLDGLYDFFWSSFNVEDCKDAKQFLVNHAGIY